MKIPKTDKITAKTTIVTPELASQWLDPETVNTANRSLSKDTVQRYAQQMESGNWMASEPVMFDSEGVLIDGQHRLAAIVESGTEQEMLVAYGYSPEVRLLINTGKTRNATDALRIQGLSVRNSGIVVGIARLYLLWERGGLETIPSNGGQTFNNWEIVQAVEEHPEFADLAVRGRVAARELKTNAQSFGFAMSLFEKANAKQAKLFEENLVNHIQTGGKTDPLFLLRDALAKMEASAGKGQGLRHHQHLALLILAWRRFIKLETGTGAFTHPKTLDRIAIHAEMPKPS